ncbi:MAG: hypothetical protein J5911_00540 [Clostridia bacterium]|nr:hypothetical protein [Clostridia bacterium]
MDNEEILKKQNNESGKGISFMDIFYIIRAHLILIIMITVLFGVGGFAYSRVRKPYYTASVPVEFKAEMFKAQTDSDKLPVDQTTSGSFLFAYLENAVAICKSGEVIERANVYYKFFLESKMDIDTFITTLKSAYTASERNERHEIPGYSVTDELRAAVRKEENPVFTANNIGTNYVAAKNSADAEIDFVLWVKNLDQQEVPKMARIYALAADVALNKILDLGGGASGLIDLSTSIKDIPASPDMSQTNIIIISVVLGFIVSLIVVYLLYLADNTVKGKEQLEKLTGANVIAYLEDVAEVK